MISPECHPGLEGFMSVSMRVTNNWVGVQAGSQRTIAATLAVFCSLLIFPISSKGEERRFLCSEGFGSFSYQFSTGVEVKVGASKRNGMFASHACDAALRWNRGELQVASQALQVDIDLFGADMGFGAPVVAFQSRSKAKDAGVTYQLYSLTGPPKLLRSINGGSYFNTQDIKLEDRNEIWTDDAAAVDGFENLPLASYDFAPLVALRFEKRKLLDVSSEYPSIYDSRIAQLKAELDSHALDDFKRSDGKLSTISAFTLGDLHRLKTTKVKVLEIAWSYLYSGREREAWNTLQEMWPAADRDRIQKALENLRKNGILRQADGEAARDSRTPWKRHAVIFDMATVVRRTIDDRTNLVPVTSDPLHMTANRVGVATQTTVDTAPIAIYLGLPVLKSGAEAVPEEKIFLDLVLDAAGKVRSAKLADSIAGEPAGAKAEIAASSSWTFIPAFKSGRAVACKIRIGVSPQR